jgi:hypothetical protein
MSESFFDTSPTCQTKDPSIELSRLESEEERIVAELGLLGIRYLSRRIPVQAEQVRPPDMLLADLVRQPSARVRAAVIAVLLAHPEYAVAVPAALRRLKSSERLTLQLFYTAAVLLQQEHTEHLRRFAVDQRLPDQFSMELGLPQSAPLHERLVALGRQHRQRTQAHVNWTGTYESVVQHLLRSWELEARWRQ